VQKEIGGKVPLVSHRRQRHWRLARYVNSQLRISDRIHSTCFSSNYLDIVKYYRSRTFISDLSLRCKSPKTTKLEFISFDVYFFDIVI